MVAHAESAENAPADNELAVPTENVPAENVPAENPASELAELAKSRTVGAEDEWTAVRGYI